MKTLSDNRSSIFKSILFILVFAGLTYSCSKSSGSQAPPANEVYIENFAFTPATLTVSVNTTVTWTNKDAVAHTVTSNTAGQFGSASLATNATFSFQFTTAGTYNYHCTIHPGMLGKVIVQ